MQYDPHVCKYEAMKHGWFSDTVVRDLAGGPCMQVLSGDIGRVRYALEQTAPVSWSPLRAIIEDEDHAMLYDTLDHCSFEGKLTDECPASIGEAVNRPELLSPEVAQMLAQFGYRVPEGKWTRLEDEKDSLFVLPKSRTQARIACVS